MAVAVAAVVVIVVVVVFSVLFCLLLCRMNESLIFFLMPLVEWKST